jgi:site-specific DNA-methyltransferase (adenine-specific)
MGSGSTGVACKKLNRKFIGFELDTKIFDVAVKRVSC